MSRFTHKALADVIHQLVDITPSIAPSSDCLGNGYAASVELAVSRSRAEAESTRLDAGSGRASRTGREANR
jgi:hypothetical protein